MGRLAKKQIQIIELLKIKPRRTIELMELTNCSYAGLRSLIGCIRRSKKFNVNIESVPRPDARTKNDRHYTLTEHRDKKSRDWISRNRQKNTLAYLKQFLRDNKELARLGIIEAEIATERYRHIMLNAVKDEENETEIES